MLRPWTCYSFLLLLGITIFTLVCFGDQVLLTSDFRNFWSAALFARHGGNPYNWDASRAFMAQRDPRILEVAMILPPWTLILPAPLTLFDYLSAARFWVFLNVLAAYFLGKTVQQYWFPQARGQLYPFLVFVFPPLLFALYSGHYPILLALCATLGLAWLRTNRLYRAGFILSFLLCKPHVFIPLGIMTVYWIIAEKKYRVLSGGLCGLAFMVFCTLLVNQNVFSDWLSSTPIWADFAQNKTETLCTLIRLGIYHLSGQLPDWPLLLVPSAMVIVSGGYLFTWRKHFSWEQAFPRALALGVIGMPYGWFYDSACLLVLFLFLCERVLVATESPARIRRGAVVGLLILLPLVKIESSVNHFLYSIYPCVLVCFYLGADRARRLQPC